MIGVLIVPTGIGAEIGGHAGDANPVAKLMAACCDTLITHPNVLNASDINEMTENTLYVEGSALDRFLEGRVGLRQFKQNKILVAANAPVKPETVNAMNAARATIGADVSLVELKVPLVLEGYIEAGHAAGRVMGWEHLVDQIAGYKFDALAIHTPIDVDRDVALHYYQHGGINPWGKAEAIASRLISEAINKPVAHAPLENIQYDDHELYSIFENAIVDPRIAPEAISNCYLHSVLKGLHRAPRLVRADRTGRSLWSEHVDVMISPHGCNGRPQEACRRQGIPVVVVQENRTILKAELPEGIEVANYWEAAGVIMAMEAGIDRASVRRPLSGTAIEREKAPTV